MTLPLISPVSQVSVYKPKLRFAGIHRTTTASHHEDVLSPTGRQYSSGYKRMLFVLPVIASFVGIPQAGQWFLNKNLAQLDGAFASAKAQAENFQQKVAQLHATASALDLSPVMAKLAAANVTLPNSYATGTLFQANNGKTYILTHYDAIASYLDEKAHPKVDAIKVELPRKNPEEDDDAITIKAQFLKLSDGTLAVSREKGIAVLSLSDQALPEHVKPLTLFRNLETRPVLPGEMTLATGNNTLIKTRVTQGIVSSVNRMLPQRVDPSTQRPEHPAQDRAHFGTDAPIIPGSTGGVLTDQHGAIIGLLYVDDGNLFVPSMIRFMYGVSGSDGLHAALKTDTDFHKTLADWGVAPVSLE